MTRLAEDAFLIVTVAMSQRRDLAWFKRHVPDSACVHVTDITSGLPMIALMGPKTRELMSHLSPDDFSNEAFPFGQSREIDLGYARVRASRLTFVGELGYEIYVEAEFAAHVYEAIVEAGENLGLKHGGFFALNSLRMEKGYRHWGHDIGEEDTPYNGGLGFAVKLDKPGGFLGRDALMRQRAEGTITRRLVQLKLAGGPDMPMLYHHEPLVRDGAIIGSVTSGAYGHRVGASLGLGYVNNADGVTKDWLADGNWEVEIAMKRYPVELQFGPWYDPQNTRVRH
jgi:heterotetrameric sarcosine oxidase gamma subunit